MRIVPDSTITLYAGVDIDNGEQLVFSSREKQAAYFESKLVRSQVPCTMVRKSGVVRLEVPGSVVSTCNYLSFVNPSFDNKTVYGRIIDYDYVNNECVEIAYAIDYWQTWMFDVTFEDMYIEREHLSQRDFDKAEVNPYDPSIFEFKTAEALSVSKDMEKRNYDIGNNDTFDGFKIGDALSSYFSGLDNRLGVYIKLAELDFEDLDAEHQQTPPSQQFIDYLLDIQTQPYGFYYLTSSMLEYLHAVYPTSPAIPVDSQTGDAIPFWVGSGWEVTPPSGQTQKIWPFYSSKYSPGCCMIYDMDGGNVKSDNGYMSEILGILTRISSLDAIISMNIIPNDIMVYAGRPDIGDASIQVGQRSAKTKINVVNKKLMRYPFSYLRVMSPNGDIKELKYEDFKELMEGTADIARLNVCLDIADQPTLIVAPYQYRYTNMSENQNDDANINESLMFSQFPTAPYTIDAFDAQVAAVTNSTIAGRTTDGAYEMAAQVNSVSAQDVSNIQYMAGSVLGMAEAGTELEMHRSQKKGFFGKPVPASLGGNIAGFDMAAARGAVAAMGMYERGGQQFVERGLTENAMERWYGAEAALEGTGANLIAKQLQLTRPAYACDQYHPSNGVGTINFNPLSYAAIPPANNPVPKIFLPSSSTNLC